MTLEMTFPIVIGLALLFGISFAVDYAAATARPGRNGAPSAWTERRGVLWQVATLAVVLGVFGSLFAAAIMIPGRDRNIVEAGLERRYGLDFEYRGGGRGSAGLWYIDGQPTACSPHGDLPHDPYMTCAELDGIQQATASS